MARSLIYHGDNFAVYTGCILRPSEQAHVLREVQGGTIIPQPAGHQYWSYFPTAYDNKIYHSVTTVKKQEVLEGTNPQPFFTLFKNKSNSLQKYDTAKE